MSTIKHVEICSIENAYRTKHIHDIQEIGFDRGEWRVSEKIHGASAQFGINDTELLFGKRTSWCTIGDGFYNWHSVYDKYKDNIKALYEELKVTHSATEVVIYGEIFGGRFDHPSVPKVNGASVVQKGIDYCPWNDFYAFDLKINGRIINDDEACALFKKFGIFHSEPLFVGTFAECMAYSNEFDSVIPERLGLPKLSPNICEGVVLRPNEPRFFGSGVRCIIKNKNDKWAEKAKGSKAPKVPEEVVPLSEDAEFCLDTLFGYVSENRLKNLLSKIGPITNKDFGKILGGLIKDTFEDFLKDHRERFESVDKVEQHKINKRVGNFCQELIRKNFISILDGNY